ncbi:hypothetical protein [Phenylobacterium sp.]|uniref:hypothetical protein n=1 Tax=Phenylobacterium sp. TaxID=1871053 RepID=UPI002FCA2F02
MPRRLLGTSLPKSGTHLLAGIFAQLGFTTRAVRKAGLSEVVDVSVFNVDTPADLYLYGHLRERQADVLEAVQRQGYQVIVMVRDPRDVCLSMVDFLASGRPSHVHRSEPALIRLSRHDLLQGVICGFDLPDYKTPPIRDLVMGWLEWRRHGGIVIRFEEIVEAVLAGISPPGLRHIDVDCEAFVAAAAATFGDQAGKTFNRGLIRRWETEFEPRTMDLWQAHALGVASYLGYAEVGEPVRHGSKAQASAALSTDVGP